MDDYGDGKPFENQRSQTKEVLLPPFWSVSFRFGKICSVRRVIKHWNKLYSHVTTINSHETLAYKYFEVAAAYSITLASIKWSYFFVYAFSLSLSLLVNGVDFVLFVLY